MEFDSFCGTSDVWMHRWKDGWMDSVSLRYSFCGKSDVRMDG